MDRQRLRERNRMNSPLNGERLRQLRRQRFLERRELAELAGISYSTLSKMEFENYVPRVSVIRAIGRALEVPPDSFLSRDWSSRC